MIKDWIEATRPKTLPAALCPVLIGLTIVISSTTIHILSAIITLVCALLIQIGTNFANDYFDHKKGADTKKRVGPKRGIQTGKITEKAMKKATIVSFTLAFILGLVLIMHAGIPILIIGILSIICGVIYTGGPFSLAYTGTADIFVLLFFGPIAVAGTVYIQTQHWSPTAILIGTGVGLIATALLAVNNIRDYDEDKKTQKKTIVVRTGKKAGKYQYSFCIGIAYLILIYQTTPTPISSFLLTLLGFIAIKLVTNVWKYDSTELNYLLSQTGAFISIYSLSYIIITLIQ